MNQKQKVNIYLVEDQEVYGLMLHQRLKDSVVDHHVRFIATGEDCLKQVKETKPDVVILDYMLPGMNGLETLRKIKEIDANIPVIMISAQKEMEVVRDLFNAGANDYVIKGKEAVDQLCVSIDRVLHRQTLREGTISLNLKRNNVFIGVLLLVILVLVVITATLFTTST